MTMRAMVCAVLACAVVSAAHAQVDFGGLDVTHYPAPAPVQKGGVNPVQGMPVTQAPQALPVAPPAAGTFAAPEVVGGQPYDAPGASWNSYRGYGYRWYPGYSRHDEWLRSQYFYWNHAPSYRSWYGQGYGWYGTDPRWYGTHPSWRPYGWRDRAYPYAWSPGSVICSW